MERVLRWCYSTIFWLIVPFLLCHLLWKSRNNRKYRQRWRERFGYSDALSTWPGGGVLLHAVSVGELNAARPVLENILLHYPQTPVMITTTTPTASEQVREWFGQRVQHMYLPFDLPQLMNRFIGRLQPRLVLVMETEIWPNLFAQAHRYGAFLAMLNARLSPRTANRYQWLSPLMTATLHQVNWLGVQTQGDAKRLIDNGVQQTAIAITGNLKFDLQPNQQDRQRVRDLKSQLGERLVWTAGSTHDGEELILLQLFRDLQQQSPNLLLVLAPRHPDRAERVYAHCQQLGLRTVRYTHSRPIDTDAEIIILDVIGQLLSWYGASDLAFLGGTLVPVGGHNAVEPAAMGCPVIVGPFRENIHETAMRLSEAQAGILLDTKADLKPALQQLLSDSGLRKQIGLAAERLVASQSGGLEKTMQQLKSVLEEH